jgi:transglutaminase-like putative cysteine protease
MKLDRSSDPLTMIHRANRQLGKYIKYAEGVTKPESPIDTALKARAGVGQDFVHIFIAMIRQLGIPCRYVSGYRYAASGSTPDGPQKTHAWAEALLPELGWVGFDPAMGAVVDECYIRSAIGRDYADIPPTRGVYKGEASSQIAFSVSVTPTREPSPEELTPGLPVQE